MSKLINLFFHHFFAFVFLRVPAKRKYTKLPEAELVILQMVKIIKQFKNFRSTNFWGALGDIHFIMLEQLIQNF